MRLEAHRYEDGSITYPGQPRRPTGDEPADTVDLRENTAEVVTSTTSHATPPVVRNSNHLAIVEFEIDGVDRFVAVRPTRMTGVGDRAVLVAVRLHRHCRPSMITVVTQFPNPPTLQANPTSASTCREPASSTTCL